MRQEGLTVGGKISTYNGEGNFLRSHCDAVKEGLCAEPALRVAQKSLASGKERNLVKVR